MRPGILLSLLVAAVMVLAIPALARDDTPPLNRAEPNTGTVTRPVASSDKGRNCFDRFTPEARGHSWTNAYLLALASHYVYPDEVNATTWGMFQQNFRLKLTPWGMDTFAFYTSTSPVIDPQCVVMSNEKVVIVVFRGTEINLTDLLTDAALPLTDIGRGCRGHSGFWDSMNAVYSGVKTTVQSMSHGQPVWLTGHSLGGAMAALCAYRLMNDGTPVQGVYTYGSPRVGDESFRRLMTDRFANRPIQRWVNDRDLVPLLPDNLLMGFRHVGQTNNIIPNGSSFQIRLNDRERAVLGDFGNHATKQYCQRIFSGLTAAKQSLVPDPPR